jgi:hypothetical protein
MKERKNKNTELIDGFIGFIILSVFFLALFGIFLLVMQS